METNISILILVLFILLILSFLGINILMIIGNYIQRITNTSGPYVSDGISNVGDSTGDVIIHTSDIIANAIKTGIDITNGALNTVGNLLKNDIPNRMNEDEKKKHEDEKNKHEEEKKKTNKEETNEEEKKKESFINSSPYQPFNPEPSPTGLNIQQNIGDKKKNWCLIENSDCIRIGDEDKCHSGQLYPSQLECLA